MSFKGHLLFSYSTRFHWKEWWDRPVCITNLYQCQFSIPYPYHFWIFLSRSQIGEYKDLVTILISCSATTQWAYHPGNMQLRLDASKQSPVVLEFPYMKFVFVIETCLPAVGISIWHAYFQANAKGTRCCFVLIKLIPCFDEFWRV